VIDTPVRRAESIGSPVWRSVSHCVIAFVLSEAWAVNFDGPYVVDA
jgi:hypothetical protein